MKILYRFLGVVTLVVLFSFPSQAETLEDAVRSALLHHPTVEAAKANAQFASEEVAEEYSGYFPEVSVNATGGRTFADNSTSRGLSVTRGEGYSYLWEGTLTARQNLFNGFETSNRFDSAVARQKSSKFDFMDTQENLTLSTVQAYVDLMRARTGHEMLLKHEDVVNEYMERIQQAVEEGAADESELQRAMNIVIVLQGLVVNYKGQIKTAESNYFEITGYLPETELEMPEPRADMIPMGVFEALRYARDNHPSLKSASFSAESAQYDIDVEKSNLYPEINGELSYLKNDKADLIGGEVADAKAVLRMNWRFELGGAQAARIDKKMQRYKEMQAREKERERRIERGIRLAFSEYETAIDTLDIENRKTVLNEKLLETNEVQFEGARITLLQLMQSHNQLFTSRLARMNAKYRLIAGQYGVLASMGRLKESFNLALADLDLRNYE